MSREPENTDIEKAEIIEDIEPDIEDIGDVAAAAKAYAQYLRDKGLAPGDPTFVEPEDLGIEVAAAMEERSEGRPEAPKRQKGIFRPVKLKLKSYDERYKGLGILSSALDIKDSWQSAFDEKAVDLGKRFAEETHKIVSTYRHSQKTIGIALLFIVIIASALLILFDRFTVYEYAYNGKVMGYVREQDEVIDVLEVAGRKLTENSKSQLSIEFVPNQNVTFNLVDSTNKSIDNSDIAVNKLVYMTDIETEAYGVYYGGDLVSIVKSEEDAEILQRSALTEMSRPDQGMELVSAEFDEDFEVRPLNVLLTAVQDHYTALRNFREGSQMEIYHIVEEGEDMESLKADYTVDESSIFDENNKNVAEEIATGDKVCIHKANDPVSVTMVERGRMREIVEFKTVKKETDMYYKGDTYVEQEGRNGISIFEGTITKRGGEEIDRKEESTEVVRPVEDKIILVGTAERPKSAPTGTFAMPLRDRFSYSSTFGYRWGRLHAGIDMACATGTPIYASDGGTVIRSGVYSGYGYCVDIDHGSGRMTRYAHCSKLLVSVGEKVYQGQNIAQVGNTGNSYGSHLHFEIRINGNPVDPAPKIGLTRGADE